MLVLRSRRLRRPPTGYAEALQLVQSRRQLLTLAIETSWYAA